MLNLGPHLAEPHNLANLDVSQNCLMSMSAKECGFMWVSSIQLERYVAPFGSAKPVNEFIFVVITPRSFPGPHKFATLPL